MREVMYCDECGGRLNPRSSAKDAVLEKVTLIDYLFPFELKPPIVYVSRRDDEGAIGEAALADCAATFGGTFAGT